MISGDLQLYSSLRATIEAAYEQRAQITPQSTTPEVGNAVETVVELLDAGTLRRHWMNAMPESAAQL